LILDAAGACRIGLKKPQNFVSIDSGLIETVEKLAVAHFPA
jgi:hypothetical protein